MEHDVLDVYIERYEECDSVPTRPAEQVFLYRRLQDAHDSSVVAVVNEMNELLGFLDPEVVESSILAALKEGIRFRCMVTGDPADGRLPILVTPVAQSEVTAILERRGGARRPQAAGKPPLAGVFDADEQADEDEDVEPDEGGVEAADAGADDNSGGPENAAEPAADGRGEEDDARSKKDDSGVTEDDIGAGDDAGKDNPKD
jgi:hypothetical protein